MDYSDYLLTDEEFFKLHEDFFGKGSGTCCEIDDTDLCYRVAKAQLEKAYPLIRQDVLRDFSIWLNKQVEDAPLSCRICMNNIVEEYNKKTISSKES